MENSGKQEDKENSKSSGEDGDQVKGDQMDEVSDLGLRLLFSFLLYSFCCFYVVTVYFLLLFRLID